MVQTTLQENPFSGHVFVFRGRRGDLIKLLWWSGDGLCLFAKRLERRRFFWPQATSGEGIHTFISGNQGAQARVFNMIKAYDYGLYIEKRL